MKISRKMIAAAVVLGVLGTSAAAAARSWYVIPHHKPIDRVIYFTDGTDGGQVYGFQVYYCDFSTYREGSLSIWSETEFYDECGA